MSNPTSLLIQSVSFGVPSGNYDGFSTTWFSVPVYGPGYYSYGSNGLSTVAYFTDGFFVGDLSMQATLAQNPTDSDWVDIPNTLVGNLVPMSGIPIATSVNMTGNFVYVRCKVSNFSAGTITKVLFNY